MEINTLVTKEKIEVHCLRKLKAWMPPKEQPKSNLEVTRVGTTFMEGKSLFDLLEDFMEGILRARSKLRVYNYSVQCTTHSYGTTNFYELRIDFYEEKKRKWRLP